MTVTENKQKQFFSKKNLIIIGIALLLVIAIVIIVILITGNPKVRVLTSEEISSTAAAIAQATLGAASTTSNQTFNQTLKRYQCSHYIWHGWDWDYKIH